MVAPMIAAVSSLLAARGRGLAKLFEAAMAGEWWAIGICALLVIGIILGIVAKIRGDD